MECRHKIAFVSTLPIEKLLPWFPVCAFSFFPFVPICILIYSAIIFYFSFRAECWLLPPTDDCNLYSWGPLDPSTGKKYLQAVNELPSMSSVKGIFKLTEAFVRAPLRSLALFWSRHHFLTPPTPPPSHAPSCSSIFSLYLPASRSSGSVAGAALSGFGSEQHSLSVWFMFRISRLMRTKEINWWFKPNETSVKLTGLINRNK